MSNTYGQRVSMSNIIEFKKKEINEPTEAELMFSLNVYFDGEGRLFELLMDEETTDDEVIVALLSLIGSMDPNLISFEGTEDD